MRIVLTFTIAIGTVMALLAIFVAGAFLGLMVVPQIVPHGLAMDLLVRLDPTGHGPALPASWMAVVSVPANVLLQRAIDALMLGAAGAVVSAMALDALRTASSTLHPVTALDKTAAWPWRLHDES